MAIPKPPANPELDKRIAERQAKLDAYVDRYNDILEQRALKYAKEIAPFWQRAGQRIGEEMARIVAEIQDAQGVPIRRQPIQEAKLRNMQRALEHLGKLLRYVQEAEQTEKLTNNLAFTYTESIYFHAFGLQDAAQVAVTVPAITFSQVMGVLANPWLPDGNTYSDRIRANTAYLALKMRTAVEEAVQKGYDINRTARNIQEIAQEGYFNSVRLARTELNRAASQGASHLFMQNADILDGKRWNATLDSRTAPKDAANDGKIYDLAYDTPEMPGRPGERIPNHPNCRCKYSPVLAALGVREGERIARGEGDTETNFGERTYTKARTYKEYAKERGIDLDEKLRNDDPRRYLRNDEKRGLPPAATATAAKAATVAATPTWLDPVKQLLAAGVDTEEKARQVGDLVRQEVERRVTEAAPDIQQQIDALTAEADAIKREIDEKRDQVLATDWNDPDYLAKYKAFNEYEKKRSADLMAKRQEAAAAKKRLANLRGEQAVKALAEIRPMGSSAAHKWVSGSHTKAKDAIARAQRFYPTEWLDESHSFNALDAKVVSRGYYAGGAKGYSSEFKISGSTDDQLTRVAVHEFGHRFEHIRPEIRRLEKQFYDRRTAGESLEWLGKGIAGGGGYGKNEKARFDKFLSRYMGKDYGNTEKSYFEIFTMGAESVFTGSYKIETDPDYYNFVMGVLASL
jgi:SPP1 gp7 family putative phage head morphogenesis protein